MNRRTVSTALPRPQRAPVRTAEADDFSAVEILGDSARAWLTQLPAYGGIALLLHAPLLGVAFLPPLPAGAAAAILVVGEMFVALLIKAALTKAVSEARRGLSSDFLELVEALKKAPAVLLVGARILARAFVRSFLLLLPGLQYLADMFAAVPVIVLEGGSTSNALRRSQKLTGGVRGPVFAICILIWSVSLALTLMSGLHNARSVVSTTWMIVYLCTRALDTSFAAVLSATTYHQLSERPDV
jgi:hypothetical protein